MHSAEGIECVKVFLFLQVGLVEVQSLGLHLLAVWKRDHHVVNDVVVLGQGSRLVPWEAVQRGLGVDDGIVGHVVHLGINVLLLITTPKYQRSGFIQRVSHSARC